MLRELAGQRQISAVLAGRSSERLDAAAADLRAAGHDVTVLPFNAEDLPSHPQMMERAFADRDVG